MERSAKVADLAYKEAGGISEEALTEVKTVAAHNAQALESEKYLKSLSKSYQGMISNGLKIGVGMGFGIAGFLGMFAAIIVTAGTLIRDRDDNWALETLWIWAGL